MGSYELLFLRRGQAHLEVQFHLLFVTEGLLPASQSFDRRDFAEAAPQHDREPRHAFLQWMEQAHQRGADGRVEAGGDGDGTGKGNGTADRRRLASTRPVRRARSVTAAAGARTAPVPGTVPGTADLMAAARAAREALRRDGLPLTRDALAVRMRAAGHPVRYSRLTPLLHALRADPAGQAP